VGQGSSWTICRVQWWVMVLVFVATIVLFIICVSMALQDRRRILFWSYFTWSGVNIKLLADDSNWSLSTILCGGLVQSVQCLTTGCTAGVWSPAEAEDFSSSLCIQTGSGARPDSRTMGTGDLPGGKSGRGVMLTSHPLLVPWLGKRGAIPQMHQNWYETSDLYLFYLYDTLKM
jgi:hypothetical protein